MKNKNKVFICTLAIIGVLLMLTNSCKKDEKKDDLTPTPTTDPTAGPTAGPNVTDIDGNVYHSVIIGTQTWMVENLKTTKYRDGSAIPNVTDLSGWWNLTTGAYCVYENTLSNSTTYGKLYNWYAVNDSRNIAPAGWHVPTDAEWTTMENYLIANGYNYGGTTTDNNYAKAMASTTGWNRYSTAGTIGNDQASNNKSGLTALPGGYCGGSGSFGHVGEYGFWWSATEDGTTYAWSRTLYYNSATVDRNNLGNKAAGFSIRCLMD